MKTFAQTLEEDRRLAMLLIIRDAGGSANESVIQQGLEMLGHRAGLTRDTVRASLRFLETAGAVELEWFEDKVAVAHITRRGVDCAAGQIEISGIKKPSLGL